MRSNVIMAQRFIDHMTAKLSTLKWARGGETTWVRGGETPIVYMKMGARRRDNLGARRRDSHALGSRAMGAAQHS